MTLCRISATENRSMDDDWPLHCYIISLIIYLFTCYLLLCVLVSCVVGCPHNLKSHIGSCDKFSPGMNNIHQKIDG